MKEKIRLELNTLEMQMEYFDTIESVQDTIHNISVMMKGNKDKDLQSRFDNLIKHFRKVYLNER